MADPSQKPVLTLAVGGRVYGGWTEIEVDRQLEAIAGTFTLTVTERWPGRQQAAGIVPGSACRVAIDGETVITGFVDDVAPRYDSASHTVRVTGRDRTGDLVDCSAVNHPGHWQNASLLDLASLIAAPFSIPVSADIPVTSHFYMFTLNTGETAFEAIERLCRLYGALPVSDGMGGLKLTRAGTGGANSALVLGQNILAARGQFSMKDRFSHYYVLGQSTGANYVDPAIPTTMHGDATDPGVGRYRPLIVQAELTDPDQSFYQRRAQWEASVRAGRAWRATITVQGWRDAAGALWHPNGMVRVTDAFLGINDSLLISGVKFTEGDQGTRAELTVTRKEAFSLISLAPQLTFDQAPAPQGTIFPAPNTRSGHL